MAYLIGTDEAGYGPNLGPLVISATVWQAPDDVGPEDLYDCLAGWIAIRPRDVDGDAGPCVAMADSKSLYTSGGGLHHLQHGLLAALGLLNHRPQTWREVWRALSPESLDRMSSIPWCDKYDVSMSPLSDWHTISMTIERLQKGFDAAGVRLLAVRSRAVFEEEFNELVERHGSKGAALSHETLALAARMMESLASGRLSVVFEKNGGRNCYGPLLATYFPEHFIEIRGEGRHRSTYRFGPEERRIEVCFRTKAETTLPAALASMASKYLRELAMQALNEFWSDRVPGIRPTAGYPVDAKRFRRDIGETVEKLNIPEHVWWRVR
jgi:hypothetical protein